MCFLFARAKGKSRMKKIKNVAYGMVFGLARFGLVMMGLTPTLGTAVAEEERIESDILMPDPVPDPTHTDGSGRCWNNEDSGARAVSVGYKGVDVRLDTSWQDSHGASIGIGVRGEKEDGTGHFDDLAIETNSEQESDTNTARSDHLWDVIGLEFCPDDNVDYTVTNIGSRTYTGWQFSPELVR